MIFDTHAHYTSRRFDGHRDAVLDSLPAQGVAGVVECGVDLATSRAALALSHMRPWIFAAAGIHPESLIEEDTSTVAQFGGDWRAELAAIEPLFEDARVVAVGEIGLDHHWPVPAEAQLALTFKNARRAVEAAAALPLESIVLETDCPYMAPEPLRGKECHSGMIRFTAERLAEIRQIPVEEVLRVTEQNARRVLCV